MNLKTAKFNRLKSQLCCEMLATTVMDINTEITPEDLKVLLAKWPERSYFRKGFTTYLGIGSKRWWDRQVKKYPNKGFSEYLKGTAFEAYLAKGE